MDNTFLLFVHSLLRYGVLLLVGAAGLLHLRGYLQQRPILTYERTLAIVALSVCHIQLVVGLVLYLTKFNDYARLSGDVGRFWKMEHLGTMLIAIALVTFGRISSKRAEEELEKQKRVAIFYLIALALMLWATPWPFRESVGHGRGWI